MYSIKKNYIDSVVHIRSGSGMLQIKLSSATDAQLKLLHEMNHPFVKKEIPKKPKEEEII